MTYVGVLSSVVCEHGDSDAPQHDGARFRGGQSEALVHGLVLSWSPGGNQDGFDRAVSCDGNKSCQSFRVLVYVLRAENSAYHVLPSVEGRVGLVWVWLLTNIEEQECTERVSRLPSICFTVSSVRRFAASLPASAVAAALPYS